MGDPKVGEVGVRLALVIIVFDIARPVLAIMDAEVGAGVCERASPTLRAAVGRANIFSGSISEQIALQSLQIADCGKYA